MAKMMEVPENRLAGELFGTTRFSWLWAILRIYLGWTWFQSGWGKVGNPAWMETGAALRGFWTNAVQVEPSARIAFDWYRSFIQFLLDGGHYTWFAKLVVFGEIFVGLALILGAFTGIAAFFGGFMNFNFMMAGTASTNPLLYTIAILLMLAWKVAGWYGLDRWLLPKLGTPWGPVRTR
ncbi:MAG: DoxX family protein [Firmicutes bacterium ZCTH02-B6]|nr:MAG: DoxX family protein [Firmicutes bacterium ZCTH02-B6]